MCLYVLREWILIDLRNDTIRGCLCYIFLFCREVHLFRSSMTTAFELNWMSFVIFFPILDQSSLIAANDRTSLINWAWGLVCIMVNSNNTTFKFSLFTMKRFAYQFNPLIYLYKCYIALKLLEQSTQYLNIILFHQFIDLGNITINESM